MAVWGIVTIIILFIVFAVFVGLNIMTTSNNRKIAQKQRFMPFASKIDPQTGVPTFPQNGSPDTPFTTNDAKGNLIPQIQCPIGTKINIVGAFFDIFDPYATCSKSSDQVNPYFAFQCIPNYSGKTPDGTTVAACNDDRDCSQYGAVGQYMCGANGTCVLAPQKSDPGKPAKCPVWNSPSGGRIQLMPITGPGGVYCVDPNMCGSNISASQGGTGVPNPVCSPNNGVSQCAMRDASATVAAKCNGRQTCGDLTMEDFGDYPCINTPPEQCIIGTDPAGGPKWYNPGQSGARKSGYCSLPFLQGYKGGIPTDGTGIGDPANYNQGYTMHGIYTCVAE